MDLVQNAEFLLVTYWAGIEIKIKLYNAFE